MKFEIKPVEKIFSVEFYKYNTRDHTFKRMLKIGDVIKAVEFNTDTQIYDILVE